MNIWKKLYVLQKIQENPKLKNILINKVINWDGLDYCILLGETQDNDLKTGDSNSNRIYTGVMCLYDNYNGYEYMQQAQKIVGDISGIPGIDKDFVLRYQRRVNFQRSIAILKGYQYGKNLNTFEQLIAIDLNQIDCQSPDKLEESVRSARVYPVVNRLARIDDVDTEGPDQFREMLRLDALDSKGHVVRDGKITDNSVSVILELQNKERYSDITKSICNAFIVDQVKGPVNQRLVDIVDNQKIGNTYYLEMSSKFIRLHANKVPEYIPSEIDNYFRIENQSRKLQQMNNKLALQGLEKQYIIQPYVFVIDQYIATVEPTCLTWINLQICGKYVNGIDRAYMRKLNTNSGLNRARGNVGAAKDLVLNVKFIEQPQRLDYLTSLIGFYQQTVQHSWCIYKYNIRFIDTDEISKGLCIGQREPSVEVLINERVRNTNIAYQDIQDAVYSFDKGSLKWWISMVLAKKAIHRAESMPPRAVDLRGIKKIGKQAFMAQAQLDEVHNYDEVETIQQQAFDSCKGLKYFPIGANVRKIGNSAFAGTGIKVPSLMLSEKVQFVGGRAFRGCTIGTLVIKNPNIHLTDAAFEGAKISRLIIQKNRSSDKALHYCNCQVDFV